MNVLGEHGCVDDVEVLAVADAGEVLTLQRAAFAEVAIVVLGVHDAGRLVRAVHDRAAGREVLLLTSEHQVAALRLYARHGYVEVRRTRAGAPGREYDLVHLRRPA